MSEKRVSGGSATGSRWRPLFHHGEGDGMTLYLPWPNRRRPFIGCGLGFSGYRHFKGKAWRWFNPYIHVGRTFTDGRSYWIAMGEWQIPLRLYYLLRRNQ